MGLLSGLFSRKNNDFMSKGDRLAADGRHHDAVMAYEEGLGRHITAAGPGDDDPLVLDYKAKIRSEKYALACLNIEEASHALSTGNLSRADEHIELARYFSDDPELLGKAESLATLIRRKGTEPVKQKSAHGCSSCSGHAPVPESVSASSNDYAMSLNDSYELLIQGLPESLYKRYCGLGEVFACSYVASSHDEHEKALSYLDDWWEKSDSDDEDIFLYEKAKLLYRMGRISDADAFFLKATGYECKNPLILMGYSNYLAEVGRFDDAAASLKRMMEHGSFVDQGAFMLAQVEEQRGRQDEAFSLYTGLLSSNFKKEAAEALYAILQEKGMYAEAENLFKRYLKGCSH